MKVDVTKRIRWALRNYVENEKNSVNQSVGSAQDVLENFGIAESSDVSFPINFLN